MNAIRNTVTTPEGIELVVKTIKELKKDEWFTIKPIAFPKDNQVYIRDDYDREDKKYWAGRCDDIGYCREFKPTQTVYTEFIY